MLCKVGDLMSYVLRATDGELGSVEDFYFDDESWTIRYLVVELGKWLPGRKVLISPIAVRAADHDSKKLDVSLTKNQVENSPDIDTHKPISRQQERHIYDYYGYPYYWPAPSFAGPITFPVGLPEDRPRVPETASREFTEAQKRQVSQDFHLRSVREIRTYYVHASDGDIGHVDDVVVDDQDWVLRYVIIDTKNWWPGKKVLVSTKWIKHVSWSDSAVYFDISREAIKSSPEYDPSAPLGRDYEERPHDHHKRPHY